MQAQRTVIQRNIFLFKTLVLLRVTAYILRQYILLPLGKPTSFRFFTDVYSRYFGEKMLQLSPQISYAQPEVLFPGIGSMLIKTIGNFDPSAELGSLVSADELQILCAVVKKNRPGKIFEIGTHRGWTTANLALNAPPNCQLITLDMAPLNTNNTEIEDIFTKYSIRFIHADSEKFDFSSFYGKIDFIFVDGSHTTADIERDSATALKMLSPKGIVVWHDHNLKFPGVVNCLHKLSTQIKIWHIPGTALAIHCRNEGDL